MKRIFFTLLFGLMVVMLSAQYTFTVADCELTVLKDAIPYKVLDLHEVQFKQSSSTAFVIRDRINKVRFSANIFECDDYATNDLFRTFLIDTSASCNFPLEISSSLWDEDGEATSIQPIADTVFLTNYGILGLNAHSLVGLFDAISSPKTVYMQSGSGINIGMHSTYTGFDKPVTFPASTATEAPIRILNGVAPTSPLDGDIWSDGSNLFVRLGGVTYTLDKT